MATFEELYGAWMVADQAAREAEGEMMSALAASPDVPARIRDRASALRACANRLLDAAMSRMRQDAHQPRRRWTSVFAA
ncbi:MAG TPA: hypothetical protein VMZ74_04160 [Ramlibacter sp.]|nr:hypothetical protein [Ramlibacter sp.]